MRINLGVATAALVLMAAPLAAQIRPDGRAPRRPTSTSGGGIVLPDGTVIGSDRLPDTRESTRGRDHIPPGQLPPEGMCRLWLDGVPPGQQPAVTTCAEAERERLGTPNSRVIYGDDQAFPGKGKGKFRKNRDHDDGLLDQRVRDRDDDELSEATRERERRGGAAHGKRGNHGRGKGHGHG